MKKAISSLAALFLVVTLALPASAASISDVANSELLYPVDIILDLDNREIRKVYDLSPSTDPSTLPMAAFERDGLEYSCTDILREVIIGTETQPLTQTETVESKKKDLETLLSLLPQEREVTTEEGFTGTLRLDLDSIETEVSGYGSSKQAVTATRNYPNLSDADTQYLPQRPSRTTAAPSLFPMSSGRQITPTTPTTMRSATAIPPFAPTAAPKPSAM